MKENPISKNWNLFMFISVTELVSINKSSPELPSVEKALYT